MPPAHTVSADFCPVTLLVAMSHAVRLAAKAGGSPSTFAQRPKSGPHQHKSTQQAAQGFIEQIFPHKAMNVRRAVDAFTVDAVSIRPRQACADSPAEPDFLAGFRSRFLPTVATLSPHDHPAVEQQPSASGSSFQPRQARSLHKRLAPHQFMHMPGAHLEPRMTHLP